MKKLLLFAIASLAAVSLHAQTVAYPNGINTNGGNFGNGCPGKFIASAVYARTIANGWGWAPDTNHFSSFHMSFTNDTHVQLQYGGKFGDTGCQTTNYVTIPSGTNGPYSPKYRFTVYFLAGATVPTSTNQCPLLLPEMLP